MSFTAQLIIDDIAVNILHYNVSFDQKASANGKPCQRPIFRGIEITVEVNKKLDLGAWAVADYLAKQLEIQLKPVVDGGRTRKIKLFDAHLVTWKTNFSAIDNQPMSETLFITAAGVEDSHSAGVYSAKWRKTFNNDTRSVVKPIEVEPAPVVTKVHWINPETKELLKETHYAKQVALRMKVDNPISTDVEIHIRKKDGTAFESGQKTLVFSETLDEEGVAELETLEIKEQWEDYKTSDIDQIVAKVVHSESTKDSEPLEIVPPPKVIVDFRPGKSYVGEYGFDYMRDKENKGDGVTYKEILGTTETIIKEVKNPETGKKEMKEEDIFTKYPNDDKYNNLKDCEYQTLIFPWYKDDEGNAKEYIQSWMTIYPDDEHTLSVQVDTIDNPKKLDLTLEYDTTYFQLSTDKIPAQKKRKKRIKDHLTIKCLKEFETDQTINVMYDKRQLGQLNFLANAKSKRKKVDVVFVEVTTLLKKEKTGSPKGDKAFLTQYLRQAFITPNIVDASLDLTSDKEFNKKFAGKGKGYIDNKKGIHDYLNSKMNKTYDNYLKVYFIGDEYPILDEKGKKTKRRFSGSAKSFGSDAVVIFKGHNTSTVTHESLHALGLYHTFSSDKVRSYSYKKGSTYNIMDYSHLSKYGSKKRIFTWLWQWKVLWDNKLVKPE